MYTQLSGSQQAVLDNETCPHCHEHGTVSKEWTRNGPTVRCSACRKKVYRPRGRAVAAGGRQNDGAGGGGNSASPDLSASGGSGSDGEEQGNGDSQSDSQSESQDGQPSSKPSQSKPTPTSQAASQSLGKPLSQAAQQAIDKIDRAVREEMRKALREATQQVERRQERLQREQTEKLEQTVENKVQSLKPTEVIVKREEQDGSVTTNTVPNAHPLLGEILRRVKCGIRNFLLVGPSGAGKTTLLKQLADALGLPYSATPWSGGTTEGAVLGRPHADGKGYSPSSFIVAFEQASVHNHDEIDAADPNVPICMNSGIENGEIFLPARVSNPQAIRHAMAIIGATANTWGFGADMMFVGRNQIDAAFRSRFAGGMLYCDYSADLEAQLVPEQSYRENFWIIRGKIFEHRLRRIWGTREMIRGALLLRGGYQEREVFTVLACGFTPDEMTKVGLA